MNLFNEDDELEDFDKQLNNLYKTNCNIDNLNASDLKISIMSATGSINSILNLKMLSQNLETDEKICFIDSMFNMTRKVSNVSKKKIFYNQMTLKMRPYYLKHEKINLNLMINLKLFRNGNLQMCGLRSENDGYLCLQILLKHFNKLVNKQLVELKLLRTKYSESLVKKIINILYHKNHYLIDYENIISKLKETDSYQNILYTDYKNKLNNTVLKKISSNLKNILYIKKYNITLINSDFYVGFKLNRNNIYNFILNEQHIICDYDPCIYQGVLIKFYWNNNKKKQNGVCNCTVPCNGKGTGNGNGECKKITISAFQSGNIIITGKCIRKEINYIYDYIIDLFHSNIDKIQQYTLNNDEPVKLKRRNISILIQK